MYSFGKIYRNIFKWAGKGDDKEQKTFIACYIQCTNICVKLELKIKIWYFSTLKLTKDIQ